jgi:hypothetical protein
LTEVFDQSEWSPLTLPVDRLVMDDDLKRLPPLFFTEDDDIENLLLIFKFVAVHNPRLEVYVYEHDKGIFSAMVVDRGVKVLAFSLTSLHLSAVEQGRRFELVDRFKPRSIGELFNEAEISGLTVRAEDNLELSDDLFGEFFPSDNP